MNSNKFIHLQSPIKLGLLEVKNRIFMAPMCTAYATIRGEVTDRLIAYYKERAVGGVGMINFECTSVNPVGHVFDHMARIDDDKMIQGYKKLTDSIHSAGAKVAIQISHAGRRTHSNVTGEIPVAPSPIPRLNGEVPRELTISEIQELIEEFAMAAERAIEAGFDAIMIHMAHGYLLHEFLSPISNKRNDEYGGNINNRMRFPIEILKKIRNKVGKKIPITCRFCGDEYMKGGIDLEQSIYIAKKLEEDGIDAIDVSAGTHETAYIMSAPSNITPGFLTHLSEGIKDAVRIPVGIVGRINDPILAEKILEEGKADFITIGRGLIADPEFPRKAFENRLDTIRPCTACNLGCNDRMYRQLDISCQVNAMVGREQYCKIVPSATKKRVLIIGGGPAGMEAARVSALKENEVFLYEKKEKLGGQLNLAGVPPGKAEYNKLIKYYEYQMQKLSVNVIHKEATLSEIEKIKPEIIIVATGGKPISWNKNIRIKKQAVMTAWDVLKGEKVREGKIVIIGGGEIGCETAEFLLEQKNKITILEMAEKIANDMSERAKKIVVDKLVRSGVEIIKQALVTDIGDEEVIFERAGLIEKIEDVDEVVMACGTVSDRKLLDELSQNNIKTYAIGDCVSPRRAIEAIREGFDVAIKI
jgi:2,4-dienoyl-CoA reductase-like NADH-dependent reductase (Old Yellow Enzyme family)/thioredoxin reductase